MTTNATFDGRIGEGWSGTDPDGAHVNLVLAERGSPTHATLLGTLGGIGIAVGTLGLGWLNLRRHPSQGDAAQKPMDLGFIALLLGYVGSRFVFEVILGRPFV